MDAGCPAPLGQLGTPSPARIAVLRALPGLGDMLCVVPALRALRAALPNASIALISLPWARQIAARYPNYVDDFVAFPGFPGLVEGAGEPRRVVAFLSSMQVRRFDLALQMHGSGGITNLIASLLDARYLAGFYEPGHYCPDPDRFIPFPAHEPEVHHHLNLMRFLGVPLRGEGLEFPVTDADRQGLRALVGGRELKPGTYVCIHPGSSAARRRWPAAHFAAVADAVAARGFRVVLTGTAGEAEITRGVAAAMRHCPIDLTGRTSLGTLAALYEDARLLICNDTGVSHLAAALRLSSVVIFVATDIARWAPLDRDRHRVISNPTLQAVREEVDDVLMQAAVRGA